MSNNTEQARIRYSRLENRSPKNTLVTLRDGDDVYFGIARCNVKLDTFNKSVGKYIAAQRAALVTEDDTTRYHSSNGLVLHESGLRGYTSVSNITKLLDHFNDVDEYCLDGLTPRSVEV